MQVYGSQKAYINRPTTFTIRNQNVEEILVFNPSGTCLTYTSSKEQLLSSMTSTEGDLCVEFTPLESGLHEIRLLNNKLNSNKFNSFELNVLDSSKLNINISGEAVLGREFKFYGNYLCCVFF
jgi:hypothetical protein